MTYPLSPRAALPISRGRRGLKLGIGVVDDGYHPGRRPRGRRGLKRAERAYESTAHGRRPRGRRGLKHVARVGSLNASVSPPSRAAWIETAPDVFEAQNWCASPPSRAAWIETVEPGAASGCAGRRPRGRRGLKLLLYGPCVRASQSPPSRAAWIETTRRGGR